MIANRIKEVLSNNKGSKILGQKINNKWEWIDRKQLNHEEKAILRVLDILVFKGYQHLKRGQGIKVVPSWITTNRTVNFITFFGDLFRKYSNT